MKIIIFLTITSIAIAIQGCASSKSKHELFESQRNYDIGKIVNERPIPTHYKIESVSGSKSRYYYQFDKTGCKWSYIIDNRSKVIESWAYESDSKKCYLEVKFFGSW